MNRRNLFKLLAGAAGASTVEAAGLNPPATSVITNPNPEYLTAEYEDLCIWLNPPGNTANVPLVRYNFIDGKWVEVPYYKTTSD